ncbi:MAG TPA: zinc-ribbon domain-containing protein, partial [Woeseiaceae bacterium]
MYTRCPECETVFRLSASALKQAGGKVRCGACDSTFNALQSLAEDFTSPDSAREFAERAVGDGHITPEQGEALLQSLERLEVPDVELEDTGVEWRVLTPPVELTEPETDDLGVDTSGIIVSDAPQDDEGPVEDAADEDEDLDDELDDLDEDEDEDLDGLDDLDDDEDEDLDDLDDLDDDEEDDEEPDEDEDLEEYE